MLAATAAPTRQSKQWLSESEAIKEKGFFGNQNSAAKPRAKRWLHTVERLKKRFEIAE